MTADEVAKDIQRVIRNHPEELDVTNDSSHMLITFPPFFLALLAFPFSGSKLATKLYS